MSFEDKVNSIIGKPYDAFEAHCWNLVEFLVPDAPKIEATAKSLATSVRHFKEEITKHNLNEVETYKDKDIMILGNNNIYFHAGVYYNGGIVHADKNGVVYNNMSYIKKIYTNIQGLRV